MSYFANPLVFNERHVFGPDGHILHAYTYVGLDCFHPYFQPWARDALEAEALWLAFAYFDGVVLHQA